MPFPHAYCCWFMCSMYLLGCICVQITVHLCCVCVIHLSHTQTDVIVGLIINNSMYLCVSEAFVVFISCDTIIGRFRQKFAERKMPTKYFLIYR